MSDELPEDILALLAQIDQELAENDDLPNVSEDGSV
jgi:hypothetical protein